MALFRQTPNRQQIALFPASVDEYVGADDIVRYVDALVDEFDLSAIESCYDTIGRPAYSPRILVKILVYGKLRGFSSSRKLAQATRDSLRFMFIASNEKPDFRTISDFRKKHHKELAGFLTQTISIGLREKLITLDCISVDGTKLKAWAGKRSFKKISSVERDLEELEGILQNSIAEDIEGDDNNDDSLDEPTLPEELRNAGKLREKLQTALKVHSELNLAEKPKNVSLTDPESRFMKGNSGGIEPSYNGQAAIDTGSMLVVGGYLNNACCDASELSDVVKDVHERTGIQPKVVVADKGYTDFTTLNEVEMQGTEVFVPLRHNVGLKIAEDLAYDSARDVYVCRQGKELRPRKKKENVKTYVCDKCEGCPVAAECGKHEKIKYRSVERSIFQETLVTIRKRDETPAAKILRRVRASTVEPTFGLVKQVFHFRQLTVRTMEFANSDWLFNLAVVNILKLAKFRMEGIENSA